MPTRSPGNHAGCTASVLHGSLLVLKTIQFASHITFSKSHATMFFRNKCRTYLHCCIHYFAWWHKWTISREHPPKQGQNLYWIFQYIWGNKSNVNHSIILLLIPTICSGQVYNTQTYSVWSLFENVFIFCNTLYFYQFPVYRVKQSFPGLPSHRYQNVCCPVYEQSQPCAEVARRMWTDGWCPPQMECSENREDSGSVKR